MVSETCSRCKKSRQWRVTVFSKSTLRELEGEKLKQKYYV